ncbi:GumC family protein [Candidatus Nitrospira bockiana]
MRIAEYEAQSPPSGTALLQEYWNIALRRKGVILGCILASLAASVLAYSVAPKSYRSETLILVEEPKIPENYVQGVVVEGNLEQHLFVMEREIKNRTLLTEIVKEFNLYPEEVAEYGIEAALIKLSNSIRVEMAAKMPRNNVIGRPGVDAFTVSFSHGDPETAMTVTSTIASKFVEENLKAREQMAEGAGEFLDEEVTIVKSELEKKEDEISRFKSAYIGELPQQMEANLRALDRLQVDLNTVTESIQRLSDRRALIEKSMQEYERFGLTNPTLAPTGHEPDPLFRRLGELRKKLVELSAQFTEAYPDMALTREELRQVESELITLYGPEAITGGEKQLDPYLQGLKKQEGEVNSELAVLKQRQRLLLAEKKDYVRRVERAPAVEQQLLILERDYDNMKKSYRSLLDKRINARVAENLEKRQQGRQFRIIDPANYPLAPDKPNRTLILALGFILGCGLGGGIAVMQEQLNPQFRRPEDIEYLLGPHLLAVIPNFALVFRATWQRLLPNPSVLPVPAGPTRSGEGTRRWRRGMWQRGKRSPELNFIVKWQPGSIIAEQYRVAATRLALARTEDACSIIAVTSAVKGEGKTTTVVNLGYTMARDLGKRTLLVDCDFKFPVLHHYAMTVPDYGLADCLGGEIPAEACMTGFGEVPCWIMPVGRAVVRSNQLLKTERLAAVLHGLRDQFDYILINTPPILPLADMNVLAGHSDALLLVVRAGSTPQQFVRRALSTLRAQIPVHVVLNAVGKLPHYMYDYQEVSKV